MQDQKTYLNILDHKRLEILQFLGFTKKNGLYLAGGTALALQIGHRTSVDFDFYTPKKFKKGELFKHFKEVFSAKYSVKIIRDFDDTFEIDISDVHLSCFYYSYKLIEKSIEIEGVKIASVEDIAAMKMVAISQRGKRRDFVDMYYLIQKLELENILDLTEKKFQEFDIYSGLRGLLYFSDADQDREISRIKVFDRKLSWKKVKDYIQKKVSELQKRRG